MGVTAKTIVNYATSQLGTKENPAGSNNVKYNTWYYGKEVSGSAYPWCAAFVNYVFHKCGADKLFCGGTKSAYCPTIENYYKSIDRYFPNKKGKVGDLCLMDFGKGRASHIGIVEKKNADGTYTVIEGNTSTSSNDNGGIVMRRIRNKSVIRGFGRPKYDTSKTTSNTSSTTTSSSNKPFIAKPTLKNGSKNTQVKYLQKDLNYLLNTNLVVDGAFGAKTSTTLKKFQKKYGLSADGIYGQKSYAKMKKLLS